MKTFTLKFFAMLCVMFVAGSAFAQFKMGDKETVGQYLTADSLSGITTFNVDFNTSVAASSWGFVADNDSTWYSLKKCQTNKGIQITIKDTLGNKQVFGDFKCDSYRSYKNLGHVSSVESLIGILEAHKAVDSTSSVDASLPAHCLFDVDESNQVLSAYPGIYKDVTYEFYFKFDGVAVVDDLKFDIDTYFEGQGVDGQTASYELTAKCADVTMVISDFYVTGSGPKAVSLAEVMDVEPSYFSGNEVFITLTTAGTATEIASGVVDPMLGIDNFQVTYQSAFWVDPAAGLNANSEMSNADNPFSVAAGEQSLLGVHVATKGRSGSLKITNDFEDYEFRKLTLVADGAVKAPDESGDYTVDVDYSFIADSTGRKGIIKIDAPQDGTVDDDLMIFVQVDPKSARTYSGRLELDCGSRIWYDVYFEAISSSKKVAYVTYDKVMDEGSAQPAEDPIVGMLQADENIDLHVLVIADDSLIDLSVYDAVVVQEGFGSGAKIFQPGNSLALASIPVPFVYNKTYALRNGKAVLAGGGISSETAGVAIKVDAGMQSHNLFSGITFSNDSFSAFRGTAADKGGAGTKALNYTHSLTLSKASTLVAYTDDISDKATSVFVNDIPAGTTIGDQTIQARMIALGQNFGAICANGGKNMTSEGLTLWRNAVYIAAGIEVPATLYEVEFVESSDASLSSLAVSVGELSPAFDSAVTSYAVELPEGTTSVELSALAADFYATVSGLGTIEVAASETNAEITVTAEDGTIQTYRIVFSLPSSVFNFENTSLIYPNPVADVLTVKAEGVKRLEFYNLSGKLMQANRLGSDQYDVSSFGQGVYIVRLIDENNHAQMIKFNKK